MAKKTAPPANNDEVLVDDREIIIKSATIKDDFLTYSYDQLKGIGIGDGHKVDGSSIIHEDMRTAMELLNKHLAFIDDAIRFKKKEHRIEDHQDDDVIGLYHVSGFVIKGKKDDEKVQLIGTKYVSIGGRIDIKTPFVHLTASPYRFYNELKSDLDTVRMEVEEYKAGKCTPTSADDDELPDQTKMQFEQPVEGGIDELESGKV